MMYVLGMGYANPTTVIDNKFLEELGTGTNAEWIDDKIGIKERLSSLPLQYIEQTRNLNPCDAVRVAFETPTSLAVKAARMALERAGITANQVGMVLVNCCTPGDFLPGEAHRISSELGILEGKSFDVFTACPVFALHVEFVGNYKDEALPDYILGISTAVLTQNVNYNDRTDGAIWGDGAAAYVISTRQKGPLCVKHSSFTADPTRCEAVVVDTYGHFHQDGKAVRSFSVLQTVKMVRELERDHEINWDRDIFIGHQANYTMLQQICDNRSIPESNHWYNVTTVGNQAGASAPAVLAMHWDQIKKGQKIVVAVVGAGLSWGSVLLEAE